MEVVGWLLDKSAAERARDPTVGGQLAAFGNRLFLCPMGELEQMYSARSATDYDRLKAAVRADLRLVPAPPDVLDRALQLQRDLAHHHGMWHRTPIPDLVIAETALFHNLGVVHVNGDFSRIAAVRPLEARRLGT